jgi:cell division protease FtsH
MGHLNLNPWSLESLLGGRRAADRGSEGGGRSGDERERRPPPSGPGRPPGKQLRRTSRTLLFWALLIVVPLVMIGLINTRRMQDQEISYTRFKEELAAANIEQVTIVEREAKGTLKQARESRRDDRIVTFTRFKTYIPFDDPELANELVAQGVEVNAKPAVNWVQIIWTYLPWIALLAIWFFFIRQMQSGPNRAFTFGKSRARVLGEDRPNVTFKDVAGADEAKQELQEIIDFLKSPRKYERLGGKIPKGVLLLGPPGTGKTLLARAVAGEAKVPFFFISGSGFVEMFVGVGASRVRDMFEQAKRNKPSIIFIDEIDAVGRQRGAGLGGGHDEREQTLNQLLAEMDGFESDEHVILIAATNRPDILDPALLRPGRFDRQVVVDRPDVKGREGILGVHTRKIPLGEDVSLATLARGTPGFSGADIANMVNEAALLAARNNRNKVTRADFEEAKDKILLGVERRSLLISEEEKKSTAYHESGHVLVSRMIPGTDPIHKVTIIPRGRALGVTQPLPIDERRTYSKEYCLNLLAFLLGGRAAELAVMNQLTTGSGDDIEKATELARKMVCDWGMSEELGPLTFGKKEEEIFLGREIVQHRDYSEQTAVLIDKEVRRIVETQQQRAEQIVQGNIEKLHRLAQALLEYEILDGEEIDAVLEGKPIRVKETRAGEEAETVESAGAHGEVAEEGKSKGILPGRMEEAPSGA